MFEAHFTKAEDFQGIETVTYSWDKTYHRRHKRSFQPLKVWFAQGKRKVRSGGVQHKIFVYIEYQDAKNNNRYHCLEVAPDLSIVETLALATQVNLVDQAQ